jgi:hypothetical protein
MMVVIGGCERTEADFRSLLADTGFLAHAHNLDKGIYADRMPSRVV